ncbi:MAG: rod shape-determining protein [Planctomycetes bacterium]|nr:rod shape-determining protein [Planctomycetota bacterium]
MSGYFDRLLSYFSTDMGIDLGTANTLVCVRGEGIVMNEPSYVAVLRSTKRAYRDRHGNVAVGLKAKEMMGRAPGAIEVVRPLKDGVIADFEITEILLSYFIRAVNRGRRFALKPRLVVSTPTGITQVEKRTVIEASERAGARSVYLLDQAMATGVGAGLPIQDPVGSMVVDIGGGTTDIAVLALAGIVRSTSLRVAGDKFNQAIIDYLKRRHNFAIGEGWAESIKILIGSAFPLEQEMTLEIKGTDLNANRPSAMLLSSEEVRNAFQEPVGAIIKAIAHTLEITPPELAADLVDTGICLAGGGSLLRGLDKAINAAIHLPVFIADNPLECVARGTGKALDDIELLAQIAQTTADD